jgi:hypothetical protein
LKRVDQILLLGFILVFLGITFIVLGQETASGFVFVFPFFFFGDANPLFVIPLIIMGVVMFCLLMKPNFASFVDYRTEKRTGPTDQYVRIGELCMFCGGPVPERSEYCPSCGNSLEAGREQ